MSYTAAMLGFAAWHWWAVGSVLSAGLFSFIVKIGAERSHGSALLNSVASAMSFACALIALVVWGGSLSLLALGVTILNAVMYVFGTLARSDSLRHIHSALFFPIYKIVGPSIVLVAGVIFFNDRLTAAQTIGFFLVLTVPLLLIDRFEHTRQKDLRLGVRLAVMSAVLISVGQVLAKVAVIQDALLPFVAINYGIITFGTGIMHMRHVAKGIPARLSSEVVLLGSAAGIFQFLGFALLLLAYRSGPISTVYAINSTYIVIPIILSIWFYREHWNARKAAAIVLSIVAVVLLR